MDIELEYELPLREQIMDIELDIDNIMYKTKCSFIWHDEKKNVIKMWAKKEHSLYLAWHCVDMQVKKTIAFNINSIYSSVFDDDYTITIE